MLSPTILIALILVYVAILFWIAVFVQKRYKEGRDMTKSKVVYALSLAIYATAWTFYGNVGSAISSGFVFVGIYIGPTLFFLLGAPMIRKIMQIKEKYGITSIADLISIRYGKSFSVGAIVAIMSFLGIIPYFALQFKAIFTSFSYITSGTVDAESSMVKILFVCAIILFTIILGFGKEDQNEKRPGLVAVVSIQSIIKLIAFLSIGIFVIYNVFSGPQDFFNKALESKDVFSDSIFQKPSISLWLSYIVLSMSAIFFLPRQFHLMIVENSKEENIKFAKWFLSLYMLFITIFVFPIAFAGLYLGFDRSLSEIFSLVIPTMLGNKWLTILVFFGGFSAAFSMILVSTLAITTMISNNILLPIIDKSSNLTFVRRYMLQVRWLVVVAILILGYSFSVLIGSSYILVKIGIISFAAVFQFVPVVVGGLYWKNGNKVGAISGLIGGFFIWAYTSVVPALIRSGFLPSDIETSGLFGIEMLKPESLFGFSGMDPLAKTIILSLIFNAGLYVFMSILFRQNKNEEKNALDFINVGSKGEFVYSEEKMNIKNISMAEKKKIIKAVFEKYFSKERAKELVGMCLEKAKLKDVKNINIQELIALNDVCESTLARYVGLPTANAAFHEKSLFSQDENGILSEMYARIVSEMRISPKELSEKVMFYEDKEKFMLEQKKELEKIIKNRTVELEDKITELEKWQKATMNREIKMIELKEEIMRLKETQNS